MFLGLLCILLWALFTFHAPFDQFGWLMLIAAAWFSGFMDCRFFARWDQQRERVMPPGDETDNGQDSTLFRS